MSTLTHEQARKAYDRIGSWQDTQAFYEDVATGTLLEHGEWASARAVFEFGCGTGRFAHTLLREHLGPKATYRGVDLSPTMVALASKRIAGYSERAAVALSDGEPPHAEPDGSCDRFVSNFVLDLLSDAEIAAVIREAHRMLSDGGLLCLASLSTGRGPASRAIARTWALVHRMAPTLVGGCRPIDLSGYLDESRWRIRHHEKMVPFCLPSQAVVAQRRS